MGAGEKKTSRAVTHMCRMRSLANDDTCVHTGGSKAKEPSCRGKRGMQRESEGGQREGRRGGWVGEQSSLLDDQAPTSGATYWGEPTKDVAALPTRGRATPKSASFTVHWPHTHCTLGSMQ